jgi:hypothetical protein
MTRVADMTDAHPKRNQPYIPAKATMVTPDQAEEELKAKAVQLSQEFEACSELIAEARKRQNLAEIRELGTSSTVQT